MFHFWLVWRYMKAGKKFLNLTNVLSFLGIIVGVACLIASMAVVSGFETTLKRAVIDVVGHVLLVKRGGHIKDPKKLVEELSAKIPQVKAHTPFVQLEAVLAHNNKITGIQVQGMEAESLDKVLNIRQRLVRGKFDLKYAKGEIPPALLGKGLAKKYNLKEGDEFRVVMPLPSKTHSVNFSPRLQKFRLAGVLDLGKHEYDERFVVTPIKAAQKLAGIKNRISGLRLRLDDENNAREVSYSIASELGFPYWTVDWLEVNSNLFAAIKLEKTVIFFVVLIMVIAACFNVSSTLFVTVLRRFPDISILRAMGANRLFLLRLFSSHGLFIGIVGAGLGTLLGVGLAVTFFHLQESLEFLPAEVYKIGKINVEVRLNDVITVFVASLAICFLSTLAPAFRGANLDPVKGIRHE